MFLKHEETYYMIIKHEVEAYRQELEVKYRAKGKLSASVDSDAKENNDKIRA